MGLIYLYIYMNGEGILRHIITNNSHMFVHRKCMGKGRGGRKREGE
jgi:hypothetical protein